MNIYKKKVGQNFHYFVSYYGFKFSIVPYCYSIVSFAFIRKEGIVYFKNEYNFWIPRAKNVRNVQFYRSHSIISKIMRPSVLQFSVHKGNPWVLNLSRVTSLLTKTENSNLNNSRNNGNFYLLFFANIHLFFCLSDSNKKSYGNPGAQFPFKREEKAWG